MFQLLKNANFDFMKVRTAALSLSGVAVLASIVILVAIGLNLGIEFAGGTEVQLKYADTPDIASVRSQLGDAGIAGFTVTRIGEPEENEVYVRVSSVEGETDPITNVIHALRGADDSSRDLNVVDRKTLAGILSSAPGVGPAQAEELAGKILERRKEVAIFHSIAEATEVEGMTPEVRTWLEGNATTGHFAVRSQSYIGPAIGKELQQKAGLAVLGSLLGMLAYIWIRFQLQWGFAAVAALAHDTIVVLGLFALFGKEMSLPVVAAFLTLVGYSVNDTVVVFDRIRENLGKMPGEKLERVINVSINQTLSRTIITSLLTLFVVVALLIFGGSALNPFAFVLTAGVVVGTYSSIWVAAPILVLWQRFVGTHQKVHGLGSSGGAPSKSRA